MSDAKDYPIWLSDAGLVDPRGWTDVMAEVAKEMPELAKDIRDEELGALMVQDFSREIH